MSEVITGVLKLAFGFISNKLRTYGAKKLEDGGLTDQKFRGWIVREMDDIKSKLDAISRKDLCASISFLQQGVQRLNLAFGESAESGGPSSSELSTAGASSTSTKPAQPSVTIKDAVALASAIEKLKLDSNELFLLANESFKEAEKQATLAFHNAALSIEDRILSSKVRIASSILENLDHTEVAASDCLHYLEELHNLPAIQQVFSVHIQGGVKSFFKKTSRAEIVETVTMINLILADFITKFTKRRMAVFDWPQIQCGKQIVHLIHNVEVSVQKMREMEITPPWDIVRISRNNARFSVENKMEITPIMDTVIFSGNNARFSVEKYAINSEGDIIAVSRNHTIGKLDRATGEWQLLRRLDVGISTEKSIAITDDGKVYIVSKTNKSLLAYDSDGKIIYHRTLDFIRESPVDIAITNDHKIVICCDGDYKIVLYVCNIKGELIKRFDEQYKSSMFVSSCDLVITCDNEITVAVKEFWSPYFSQEYVAVDFYVYSLEGKLKSTFKLQQSCRWCGSIVFNHVSKNYTAVSSSEFSYNQTCIEGFSGASGFVRNRIFLDKDEYNIDNVCCRLVSHRNGAMALVNPRGVLYLQSPSK